jgi:hypothetical protein
MLTQDWISKERDLHFSEAVYLIWSGFPRRFRVDSHVSR